MLSALYDVFCIILSETATNRQHSDFDALSMKNSRPFDACSRRYRSGDKISISGRVSGL